MPVVGLFGGEKGYKHVVFRLAGKSFAALEPEQCVIWRLEPDAIDPIETVLAQYLGSQPSSLTLRRSRAGKPELQGSAFRANLSHSGEVALVAVANGHEVRVDVELVREGPAGWSSFTMR